MTARNPKRLDPPSRCSYGRAVIRRHPKNPWISNAVAARMLIFMTRHRLPVGSRVFMYLLGCDIGLALPKTVFLPHPMGIVIHGGTRIQTS